MTYDAIIETLIESIPELAEYERIKEFFQDENWKEDYLAYVFYGCFSSILIGLLHRK